MDIGVHSTISQEALILPAGLVTSNGWDPLLVLRFSSSSHHQSSQLISVCPSFDLFTEKWQSLLLYHIIKPPDCHLEHCSSITLFALAILPPEFFTRVPVQRACMHRAPLLLFVPVFSVFECWCYTIAWHNVVWGQRRERDLQPAVLCCFTPCGGTQHRQAWYN